MRAGPGLAFGAGALRERIRFEKRGGTEDGYGNTVPGPFEAQFTRAAAFLMKPGSEAVLAARLTGRQPVTMIVRFDRQTRTITPSWRAVDERTGTVYAIQAAADMDRRRQWITLVCMAGETA
ncbi:head-tail adaptor protein [Methylobacterium nodulans]|uniref:Phage head-tail adaptor n=1 Tax=Methylobacterium nodulans (strain LMG 21967 / CNCM I-2342 / ORS 2060) TaxID=460265 RepID=B8IAA0_METNO|nr:head-tail adaptor protein [Methylobacterium nodulans]ACL59163.1 phage head-tail adaptor [Methylobacterium nodulans ORS 2060]